MNIYEEFNLIFDLAISKNKVARVKYDHRTKERTTREQIDSHFHPLPISFSLSPRTYSSHRKDLFCTEAVNEMSRSGLYGDGVGKRRKMRTKRFDARNSKS
jgi:hypothetical protein